MRTGRRLELTDAGRLLRPEAERTLAAAGEAADVVPLDPPLHETFAFIRRRNARLSPATRALMTLAEEHLAALTG